MDQIERLARTLAKCDPEGAPYESATGAEADGNVNYWRQFAENLLRERGAVGFDRDLAEDILVELVFSAGNSATLVGEIGVDNSAAYKSALDQLAACYGVPDA